MKSKEYSEYSNPEGKGYDVSGSMKKDSGIMYGSPAYYGRKLLDLTGLILDPTDESLMEEIKNRLSLPLGVPSMPIQDALEFVETLAYITIQMSKFVPGNPVLQEEEKNLNCTEGPPTHKEKKGLHN